MTAPLVKKHLTPSLFSYGRENIIFNGQGIDTIEQMAHYKMAMKLINKLDLKMVKNLKGTPINDEVQRIKKEAKNRGLTPIIEVFKLSIGKSLASFMVVSRFVPQSIKQDQEQKKKLGTHCILGFAGLHQPTKRLHSETMGVIKRFLDRKRFYILKLDIATDITDHKTISHKRKKSFKRTLAPYAENGVIAPPNGASSLYINNVKKTKRIKRILFYDKFAKQKKHQKQKLNKSLEAWKRIETTVSFDLSKARNRMSFKEYVHDRNLFFNDLVENNEIVGRINKKEPDSSYLMYQISTFLDLRTINNFDSKQQFNSSASVERFKKSEYQRYILPI